MRIHRHTFKAFRIVARMCYNGGMYGYDVFEQCAGCGKKRGRYKHYAEYSFRTVSTKLMPTVEEYNRGIKLKKDIVMSKAFIGVAATLGVLFMLGAWLAGNYNSLVTASAQVDKSWASVEVVYQRRADLINNLVETVKGAMGHETEVFKAIADARTRYAGVKESTPQNEKVAATQQYESAFARLMVVMENYPQLKALENVTALQSELRATEDGIAKARDGFNTTATNYNINIARFPKNLFANAFGYGKRDLFKSDSGASKAPSVKF